MVVCAHHLFTKQTLITSFDKLNQSPAHLFHCWLFLLPLKLFFMGEFLFYCQSTPRRGAGINGVFVWVLVLKPMRFCIHSDLFNV